jgi:tyrosinase
VNGPFTQDQFSVNVPSPHCLTRDFTPPIMNSFAQQSLVDVVLATEDYTAFARAIENVPSFDQPNIHGSGHFGVGGALGTIGDAYNNPGGESTSQPMPFLYIRTTAHRIAAIQRTCSLTDSIDPLFYLHHAQLDRILTLWQSKDLSLRTNQVGGPIVPFDYGGQNVTLDFEINIGALAPNVTLKQVLEIQGDVLCYTYADLSQ